MLLHLKRVHCKTRDLSDDFQSTCGTAFFMLLSNKLKSDVRSRRPSLGLGTKFNPIAWSIISLSVSEILDRFLMNCLAVSRASDFTVDVYVLIHFNIIFHFRTFYFRLRKEAYCHHSKSSLTAPIQGANSSLMLGNRALATSFRLTRQCVSVILRFTDSDTHSSKLDSEKILFSKYYYLSCHSS